MLDFLDKVLCIVIGYGIPVLIGIYGLVCVIAFFAMLPKSPDGAFFFGTCGICVYGFFVWFAQCMGRSGSYATKWDWMYGELVCSGVVAALVMGVCILIGKGIRMIGIPWIIIFLVYLGIAIFGI